MSSAVSVYAVFADEGEAERIGRAMIEQGLAGCINILGPCRSIYRWHGMIEEAREVPALFKTRADQVGSLIAAIGAAHSYEAPAIVAWPASAADPRYLAWLDGI